MSGKLPYSSHCVMDGIKLFYHWATSEFYPMWKNQMAVSIDKTCFGKSFMRLNMRIHEDIL
jgi:hypothetical protein